MAGVVAALLLVVVLFKSILASFNAPAQDSFVVPSVLDKTITEASAMPEVSGIFELQDMGTIYSDEYPEGSIAKQEPAAGEYRKGDNTVIKVWVSAGEEVGEMLDITNMTVAQANAKLKSLLKEYDIPQLEEPPEEEWVYNDTVEAGFIISSDPAEGEALKKGDTISVVVSKGKEIQEYPVPQFVGQSLDSVLAQLDSLGLKCDPATDVTLVDSNEPGGTIIWQSLALNDIYQEGDTIKFQVSSGLASVTIVQFYDLPQDGRESIRVQVYVGSEDTPQYDNTVDASEGHVKVLLTGSGTQNVRVYFDGTLDQGQGGPTVFE